MKTICYLTLGLVAIGTCSFLPVEKKKVAVVTCYLDKYMTVVAGPSSSSTQSFRDGVQALAMNDQFDLTSTLTKFHDAVFGDYSKEFKFDLLPEQNVIGSEGYRYYVNKFGDPRGRGEHLLVTSLPYPGYHVLLPEALKKQDSNKMRMLELFKGQADGVMFINLGFEFQPKAVVLGKGTAGIAARMNIRMYDHEGKEVFNLVEYALAEKTIPMVKGEPVLELESIEPLCEEAADKLIKDVAGRLPNLVKKVSKKF